MTTITLTKDFFFGGRATFTVSSPSGKHYTYKVGHPKENPQFSGPRPFLAKLLTGPDNTSSYTYLGKVDPETGAVKMTRASKMTLDSDPVKVLKWALERVINGFRIPDGYAIQHEGKCGCCGRVLTHPESLKNGIGPECIKKFRA